MKKTILLLLFILSINFLFSQENNSTIRFGEKKLNSPTQIEKARTCYNKGYDYFHINDYKNAISFYRCAIQNDSLYTDAFDNLALSYRRLRVLDSAEYFYLKSLSINSSNLVALNNLALVYTHENKLDKSEQTYLRILKIDPKCADGYFGLAEVYLRTSRFEASIENGMKAYDLWEKTDKLYAGDALFYVGVSYLSLNDKKNAKKYFDIAKKLGTRIPEEYLKQIEK